MNQTDQIITPHTVSATTKFNYDILIDQFGLKPINEKLVDQIKGISGDNVHHFIDRNIFYAHQDFDKILEAKKSGKEIYIYTGRGPSADALHLGHLVPIMFTIWLQQILDCWVVIEMSDEEKFYFKDGCLDEFMAYTENNTKDIIACGFNPDKTFIFSSFKYERYMRPLVAQINKKMSVHVTKNVYGFTDENSIGQLSWAPYQMGPALCGAFPHLFGNKKDVMCLVPCAIDQVPYFRITRDIAEFMGYPKPALICSKFLVGLQGVNHKASSTSQIPPIFLSDSELIINKKIMSYAFSGGGDTLESHRKNGGNLEVDVPYIYLSHFLENTSELNHIAQAYSGGHMLTGEIKKRLVKLLIQILGDHAINRKEITSEIYNKFFTMIVQPDCRDFFKKFSEKYIDITIV